MDWEDGEAPEPTYGENSSRKTSGEFRDVKTWPNSATIYGSLDADILSGGNHPQIIMGLAGKDTLSGNNSLDCLVGGPGDDTLIGGNGTDILIGGPGRDHLTGGNGVDVLIGDAGSDTLDGGNGPDIILAGPGDTVVDDPNRNVVLSLRDLDDCDASVGMMDIVECLLPEGLDVSKMGFVASNSPETEHAPPGSHTQGEHIEQPPSANDASQSSTEDGSPLSEHDATDAGSDGESTGPTNAQLGDEPAAGDSQPATTERPDSELLHGAAGAPAFDEPTTVDPTCDQASASDPYCGGTP